MHEENQSKPGQNYSINNKPNQISDQITTATSEKPVNISQYSQSENIDNSDGKIKKGIIITILVILLLIIIGVIYWYFQANHESSKPTATEKTTTATTQPITQSTLNTELNSINLGNLNDDFKQVDQSINTL